MNNNKNNHNRGFITALLAVIMAIVTTVTSMVAPLFGVQPEASDNTPAVIVNFTVGDETYQAEDGMTWADWINSDYNTGFNGKKFIVDENNVVIVENTGVVYYKDDRTTVFGNDTVWASDDYDVGNLNINIITFTIDGTTYKAEEGMTWTDWVNSDYNVGYGYEREKFIVDENDVVVAESFGALYYKEDITPAFGSDTILANDYLGVGNLNNPILPIL